MDSHRLPRRLIPLLRTKKTPPSEDLNNCLENQEQTSFLNNVVSSPQNFNPCPNNSDCGTLENKRHPEKGEKVQGTSETGTETPQSASKEGNSCTYKLYEKCKNILQDKLEAMRRKKAANKALLKEKQHEDLEEQGFCPKVTFVQDVQDRQEREKRAVMQKSNAWDAQIESKKQKKRGIKGTKRQEAKTWCPIRRQRPLNLSTAKSHEVSGKDKHDKQLKKPLSCKKEENLIIQVTQNAEDQVVMQWQKYNSVSEGIQSEYVHHEREKKLPEKVKFQEKCKKMAYDNLEDIKRKEAANNALEQEKFYKEMAKGEFAQKLLDKQEREKKVEIQKALTDAWDGQVEFKRQKKVEMDQIERQQMAAIMEADRLCPIEEIEMRRQKEEKDQKFFKQGETEQNTEDQVTMQWEMYQSVSEHKEDVQSESECINHMSEMRLPEKFSSLGDCKKIVYDNLEDLKRKEAANYILLEEKRCKERAKQQLGKRLREEQEREKKGNLKKSLTDTWDAQIQCKQQKKKEIAEIERQQMAAIMESDRLHQIDTSFIYQYYQQKNRDRSERQGLLPRSDKLQDETKKNMDNPDVMQWEMYHSVTEEGRDVWNESGFLDYESDCDIPDKDRSREIRKKIVYDQLSLIKKEEASKRAFKEDKLLKEMKQREFVEQMREKLQKEKKAAGIKSLTDSWDSQIKCKQQEKKELCEIERKDMLSLIELERVCESQNNKRTQLQKHKTAVHHKVQETLAEARPGRSCSKSYVGRKVYSADKQDDRRTSHVCRPLLSRQKVRNTKPFRLPSLNSNSLHNPLLN